MKFLIFLKNVFVTVITIVIFLVLFVATIKIGSIIYSIGIKYYPYILVTGLIGVFLTLLTSSVEWWASTIKRLRAGKTLNIVGLESPAKLLHVSNSLYTDVFSKDISMDDHDKIIAMFCPIDNKFYYINRVTDSDYGPVYISNDGKDSIIEYLPGYKWVKSTSRYDHIYPVNGPERFELLLTPSDMSHGDRTTLLTMTGDSGEIEVKQNDNIIIRITLSTSLINITNIVTRTDDGNAADTDYYKIDLYRNTYTLKRFNRSGILESSSSDLLYDKDFIYYSLISRYYEFKKDIKEDLGL